jgi:hypothetical protein
MHDAHRPSLPRYVASPFLSSTTAAPHQVYAHNNKTGVAAVLATPLDIGVGILYHQVHGAVRHGALTART